MLITLDDSYYIPIKPLHYTGFQITIPTCVFSETFHVTQDILIAARGRSLLKWTDYLSLLFRINSGGEWKRRGRCCIACGTLVQIYFGCGLLLLGGNTRVGPAVSRSCEEINKTRSAADRSKYTGLCSSLPRVSLRDYTRFL